MSLSTIIKAPFLAAYYLIAGTLVLALGLIVVTSAHIWIFGQRENTAPVDTIFVLGTAQYDGVPSDWFAARLDHAAQLYEQGVAPRIVTVGGKQDGDRFTEAQAGRAYLEQMGIPQDAITTLNTGTDTFESVQAYKCAAGTYNWGSAVVVTDPSHSLRSVEMMKDQGITVHSSPTQQGPSNDASFSGQLQSIVHETGGIIQYKLGSSSWENYTELYPQALSIALR